MAMQDALATKKIIGRPFKKGQSGNPHGRKPVAPELLIARKLSKQKFEDLLHKFLHSPHSQLQTLMDDPNTDALDMIVAGIISKAIYEGCTVRLNFLLTRLGIFAVAPSDDNMVNVSPPLDQNAGPTFIVELNSNGKFIRARPREIVDTPSNVSQTLEVSTHVDNPTSADSA